MSIDLQYKLYLNKSLKNKPITIVRDLLKQGFYISTSSHWDYYNETGINKSTNNFYDIMESLKDNENNVIYVFKDIVYLDNQPKECDSYIGFIKFDHDVIIDYSYDDFMINFIGE
jgi:hypothetical protein